MRFFVSFFLLLSLTANLWATSFDHTHGKLNSLLGKFTRQKDGQTWVDYAGIKTSGRSDLQSYLKSLSSVTKEDYKNFNNDQKLAFLINAYNAFTIEWILLSYPVKSIKDTGTLLSSPWKKEFPRYTLLGENFTLDSIEHDRIRAEFKEPRIHFAVNCASIGCPSLRPSAYTGQSLQKELAEAEKAFFQNPGKFAVKNQKVYLSSILDWYGGDFKKVFGSVENYIAERAAFYGVGKGLNPKDMNIEFMDYDWNLNGK